MKKYNFSQEFKKQVSENIYFLIKVIYNILCIIKKYKNLKIFLLVLNKLSQTLFFFSTKNYKFVHSKGLKNKQKLVMSNSLSSKWITKKKKNQIRTC